MKLLFIGDIVGKSGRDIVSSLLFDLKKKYNIDLVVANGENSAHGKGITYSIYKQLINYGIDYISLGNHAYSKSEILNYVDLVDNLVFPYNHYKHTNEKTYQIFKFNDINFCLVNILGTVLISESNLDPYISFDKLLNITKAYQPDLYIVDLHAETTAEKRLFLEYYKDIPMLLFGTHTHVQTADETIIYNSSFISDVGMCGAYNSIIGRDIQESIDVSIKHLPSHYEVAKGDAIFCAVVVEIDEKKKIPVSIERIQIRP